MTRTYSRTNITVPGPPRPLLVISFLFQPTPDHHRHHSDPPWTTLSLPEPFWSTKSTSGLLKSILATPCLSQPLQAITTITHHSRTTIDQSKSPRPLQTTRTFFWTTSAVPSQPRTFLANPYSSQPFKTINAIAHHSGPTLDQAKPPRPLQMTRTYSRANNTVPGPPQPLRAKSLHDWLSPLQDHQLCSRSAQTKPGYSIPIAAIQTITIITHHSRVTLGPSKSPMPLQTTRTHSRTASTVPNQPGTFLATPYLSQPVQTTNAITHHFRTSMGQAKPPRPLQTDSDHYKTQKLFQAHTDLFQPHHQEFAVGIHKFEMNKDLA